MLGNVATIIAAVLVVIAIGWIIIRLLSHSYIKTTPTTAFVRTGGLRQSASSKPLVVVNGAAWVFGFLHRIKWVSLETMSLEVRHIDSDALVTNDPQYVDLEARFFIKVADDRDSISMAARTIGGDMVDEASVRRIAEAKINSAVRDVAGGFSLDSLLQKRVDYIKQVQERLKADLAENGLVLESISILVLRPTLQGHFSTDDILGAQVARANSAVIEQALTEKNRLENLGALERTRQDAQAERERMGIDEEIEKERAQRTKNVALVKASEEAAAKIVQEEKRQDAERAHLLAVRALQEESLENERLEILLREKLQQASETERVQREQAVALAERERERRVAEAAILQIEADKKREQALQEAMTVTEKAAAEREGEIELINARLEAEKQIIENKNRLEVEVMRLREMAEAERSVSEVQADATRTRAQAELDATKLAALGEREKTSAPGLAEIQVALERLKVLEKEAETTRLRMLAEAEGDKAKAEAMASHEGVGQTLELARLEADVTKAIEIARAEALAEAISSMKMNLYGDAAMARQLLQLVATAQSAQHVYDALPEGAQSTLRNVASRLTGQLAGQIGNHSGNGKMPEALESLIRAVQTRYPEAVGDGSTLGALADVLLTDDNQPEEVRSLLQRLISSPAARDLPVQTALDLAREWFKG